MLPTEEYIEIGNCLYDSDGNLTECFTDEFESGLFNPSADLDTSRFDDLRNTDIPTINESAILPVNPFTRGIEMLAQLIGDFASLAITGIAVLLALITVATVMDSSWMRGRQGR